MRRCTLALQNRPPYFVRSVLHISSELLIFFFSMTHFGKYPTYSDFDSDVDYQQEEEQQLLSQDDVESNTSNTLNSVRSLVVFMIATVVVAYTASVAFSLHQKKSLLYSASSSSKPNFVFILSDDVGWNSIGYQNYDLAFATPYMTALAEGGIILSNYYSQEVCTPARASLMTGRYPFHAGLQFGVIKPRDDFGLSIGETLLPEVLKSYGSYTNYILGKWNLGHCSPEYLPTARGFDYFMGKFHCIYFDIPIC